MSDFKEQIFRIDEDTQFTLEHNLPETFGLSIDNAFQNWLMRTNEFTAESLKNYIDSKRTGYTVRIK